jgi:quercetin dioxygenase-like cupin family protein
MDLSDARYIPSLNDLRSAWQGRPNDLLFRLQMIELPAGKSFEPHVHVSIHLIYALAGSGSVAIWDSSLQGGKIHARSESKKDYHFSQGDLLVLPMNVVHAFSASRHENLKELIINLPGLELHDHDRIIWA